jgi:hypothetical protein
MMRFPSELDVNVLRRVWARSQPTRGRQSRPQASDNIGWNEFGSPAGQNDAACPMPTRGVRVEAFSYATIEDPLDKSQGLRDLETVAMEFAL